MYPQVIRQLDEQTATHTLHKERLSESSYRALTLTGATPLSEEVRKVLLY